MSKRPIISLRNISKTYTLHHEKPTFVENIFRQRKIEKFKALNNVNLDIFSGEKVGIIGSNGSGKTTLLKIISGISTPTKGKIQVNGKVVSLIDLNAGFHPDLTGEENIFLNGLLIGMTKHEIRDNFEQIINFADIKQFIDAHLYTYSAGMKLRLGFSIAIHSNFDILLLDEGVSVGDEKFQRKVGEKINTVFKQGKTVIVVSHWLEFLKKNCRRIIWLERGRVRESGGINNIIDHYCKHF